MDKSVKTKRPTNKLAAKQRLHFSRRTWLIVAVVVLAIPVSLGAYHQYVWGQHTSRIDTTYTEAQSAIESQLKGKTIDAKAIVQLSSDATAAANDLCKMPFLGGIREQLLESARQQQSECDEQAKKLLRVASTADALANRVTIEAELTVIYKDVQQMLAKTDRYQNRPQLWRDAKERIEATKADQSYQEQKKSLITAIDTILTRYEALSKADNDEKRPEFDEATKKLQTAYDALSESVDEAKRSYENLAVQLVEAAEAL